LGQKYLIEKCGTEGTPVPIDNVMMTVENTDPKCFSLTNFCETILSHVWAPSTVATISRRCKEKIKSYLEVTSDNFNSLDFMLHDFGYRGVTSPESAGLCGAGHLINFMGTDTFAAINVVMDHYNQIEIPAFSVKATEHSIMTSLGKDGEVKIMEHLLNQNPNGILAWVIDSYNYKKFIEVAGTQFKDQILNRDGKLVFRPDSGDPSLTSLDVIELLGKYFGFELNQKGYKVLNPKIGMLWGDGIDIYDMEQILSAFQLYGWAASNIVFGMGGGLLQKINRDTQMHAFKSSYQVRNGKGYDIYKQPISGTKRSKAGKLLLIKTESGIRTINELDYDLKYGSNLLETVFENGRLIRDMSFSEIRANAKL